EVLAEADKLLARLAEEQAADTLPTPPTPATTPPAPSPEPPPFVAASARPIQETPTMTTPVVTDLKSLLAQRLELKPEEANEARLVLAMEQGQQALRTLGSLLEALGVQSPQAAAAKVADLIKRAATLDELQPKYDAMKTRVEAVEESEAEAEV